MSAVLGLLYWENDCPGDVPVDWDATTVISSLRVMAQPLGIEEPSMDIPNPCQQYSGCCFVENDCPGGMPVDWDATKRLK